MDNNKKSKNKIELAVNAFVLCMITLGMLIFFVNTVFVTGEEIKYNAESNSVDGWQESQTSVVRAAADDAQVEDPDGTSNQPSVSNVSVRYENASGEGKNESILEYGDRIVIDVEGTYLEDTTLNVVIKRNNNNNNNNTRNDLSIEVPITQSGGCSYEIEVFDSYSDVCRMESETIYLLDGEYKIEYKIVKDSQELYSSDLNGIQFTYKPTIKGFNVEFKNGNYETITSSSTNNVELKQGNFINVRFELESETQTQIQGQDGSGEPESPTVKLVITESENTSNTVVFEMEQDTQTGNPSYGSEYVKYAITVNVEDLKNNDKPIEQKIIEQDSGKYNIVRLGDKTYQVSVIIEKGQNDSINISDKEFDYCPRVRDVEVHFEKYNEDGEFVEFQQSADDPIRNPYYMDIKLQASGVTKIELIRVNLEDSNQNVITELSGYELIDGNIIKYRNTIKEINNIRINGQLESIFFYGGAQYKLVVYVGNNEYYTYDLGVINYYDLRDVTASVLINNNQRLDDIDGKYIHVKENDKLDFIINNTTVNYEMEIGGYEVPDEQKRGNEVSIVINDQIMQQLRNNKRELIIKISDITGDDKQIGAILRYYPPIEIVETKVTKDSETNNIANNYVKAGDTVNVEIDIESDVYVDEILVCGNSVAQYYIANEDHNSKNVGSTEFKTKKIMFEYTLPELSEYDGQGITVAVKLHDEAYNYYSIGNTAEGGAKDLSFSTITYHSAIMVDDTYFSMESTNSKNPTSAVKDNDEIVITFYTNHEISKVEENSTNRRDRVISITSTEEMRFGITIWKNVIRYRIKNGDLVDLSKIKDKFIIADRAGNTKNIDTEIYSNNVITYYAPLDAEVTFEPVDNEFDFVKNGDTVGLRCVASHNVSVASATVLGRTARVSGTGSDTVVFNYTIPEHEGVLPEGAISFACKIEDPAGNMMEINSLSNDSAIKEIIYDRTMPIIRISQVNEGTSSFFSGMVTYVIEYTGTNIYEDGLSCEINGVESIKRYSKEVIEDGYRITVQLSSENNYAVSAHCVDKAGNREANDASVRCTIDKTNPVLNLVQVNTGHVFAGSFKLSDYLDIEEDNLQEFYCTLTDVTGTYDWNINDLITGDGKKTVTIRMTDLAGNMSNTYVYEFYIDITPPSPLVMEMESGYLFNEGEALDVFDKNITLKIALENIQVGNQPDTFTKVVILDADGNMYIDVLADYEINENGAYEVEITESGKYTLQIQAKDSLGNDTGIKEYGFEISKKEWYKDVPEDNPEYIIAIVIAVAVVILGSVVFIGIRRRNRG